MLIKAKDLTPEMRKSILDQIQQQVGYAEYNRLIDTVGENSLIDFALAQTYSNTTNVEAMEQPKSQPVNSRERSYVFYIALLLAIIAGALYPDGELFTLYYDYILPVGVCIVIACIILLWVIGGVDISGVDISSVGYLFAGLITIIIASFVGVVVNISKIGIKVVEVVMVAFVYCSMMGNLFGIPYYKFLNEEIESEFWKGAMGVVGFIIALIILGLGWAYVIFPLFS